MTCQGCLTAKNTCSFGVLQFYSDFFETLQVFRSWSEDVHIVWMNPLIIFCLFSQNEPLFHHKLFLWSSYFYYNCAKLKLIF